MHVEKRLQYLTQALMQDPLELWRLFRVGLTTARYRYVYPRVGKGTVVEPGLRIINAANVRIGRNCLLKEGIYLRAGSEGRITLGDRVAINCFCQIYGHGSVQVGDDTQIGPNSLITTTDHDYSEGLAVRFRSVQIGQRVWIGANVTVLPGVTIGDGAVIGAGSVVHRDIPAHTLAVGVPAQVRKELGSK